MEIIWNEIDTRTKNQIVDLIKRGEGIIFVVGNSTKELNSFVTFMNRLKKLKIEMSIRMTLIEK